MTKIDYDSYFIKCSSKLSESFFDGEIDANSFIKQAEAYKQEAMINNRNDWVNYWEAEMLYISKDYSKSLEHYNKAIQDRETYLFIISKAHTLGKLANYDEAIQYYEKALKYEEAKKDGIYIDLSTMYCFKGEYEKAIEVCTTKVSEINYKYYNIYGFILALQKKYTEALDNFFKADQLKENECIILKNIAYCYEQIKDYPNAIEFYQKALSLSKISEDKDYIQSRIFNIQKLLDDSISAQEKEIREMISTTDEESRYLSDVLENHVNANNSLMSSYIERYKTRTNNLLNQNQLIILKGWSSSTPEISQGAIIDIHNLRCKGGGHYIRWQNKGVVIDPGIHFVENMHSQGLTIMDIDYVIVTHNHIDHNFDLLSLHDLNYQFFNFTKEPKFITYYLDSNSYGKFMQQINIYHKDQPELVPLRLFDQQKQQKVINSNILLEYIPTKHNCEHSVGINLQLTDSDGKKLNLGYTSDSMYIEQFNGFFKDSDIIIANFSETNAEDLRKERLKDTHLGYYGSFQLLSNDSINPKCFILSEFWGGKGDIRFEISKKLKHEQKILIKQVSVIPGDIGMCILLDSLRVVCSRCNSGIFFNNLTAIKPHNEYGQIKYLCRNCIF